MLTTLRHSLVTVTDHNAERRIYPKKKEKSWNKGEMDLENRGKKLKKEEKKTQWI